MNKIWALRTSKEVTWQSKPKFSLLGPRGARPRVARVTRDPVRTTLHTPTLRQSAKIS